MPLVKMWKQGQLTIPSAFRKELGLEGEEKILSLVKVGFSLLLTPKRLQGDALAGKMAQSLKKKKLSLDDVLDDLREERRRYNKEVHGL